MYKIFFFLVYSFKNRNHLSLDVDARSVRNFSWPSPIGLQFVSRRRLLNRRIASRHTTTRAPTEPAHRKASITADLGSLGFLLIISLIAELIGRVWKARASRANYARERLRLRVLKKKNITSDCERRE